MANNYMQWSEEIEALTVAERKWVRRVLQLADDLATLDADDPSVAKLIRTLTTEVSETFVSQLRDLGYMFEWNLASCTQTSVSPLGLWLYSEEGGNIGALAEFVKAFLSKFRPKAVFGLTYASWCSKLRVGEFGGGTLLVTAKKIRSLDSGEVLERWRKQELSGQSRRGSSRKAQRG